MHSTTEGLFVALLAASQVSAVPVSSNDASLLFSRDYQQYKGCTPAQKAKIEHAFSDAAVLARFVESSKNDAKFATDSSAFQNYFPADSWTTGIQGVYQAIGKQWAAPKPINGEPEPKVDVDQFNVIITCEDPEKRCESKGKGTKSFAYTDTSPQTKTFTPSMTICPGFFSEPETKNNLDSLPYKLKPKRGETSWCKTGEKFKYFEVAGHTILHELTHLNAAGAAGGLDPRPADPSDPNGPQTQGTDDINGMPGYSVDPETAARQLHAKWKKIDETKPEPPKDTWPPFVEKLNAESYAAAALEWWFMQQCEFPDIEGN